MVGPVFFPPPPAGRGVSIIPMSWGLRALSSLSAGQMTRLHTLYGDMGNLFKDLLYVGTVRGWGWVGGEWGG